MLKKQFINNYWQKEHCLFKQAFCQYSDTLTKKELIHLSTSTHYESRVITGDPFEWECQYGPFDTESFEFTQPWTLLVQGIEQLSHPIASILELFSTLPKWRVDDLMASYASKGAGVGPHFDYYDVFLLQISGKREWFIGQHCSANSPLLEHSDLQLLKDFETQQSYQLRPGDMIYVPAKQAHWGTATSDNCITLSIGFRAPSDKDILLQGLEHILEKIPQDQRYSDTTTAIDSDPYKINDHAKQKIDKVMQHLSQDHLQQAIHLAFGELVTESKYHHFDNESNEQTIIKEGEKLNTFISALKDGQVINIKIQLMPNIRVAYNDTHFFIDGQAYACSNTLAKQICHGEMHLAPTKQDWGLLKQLVKSGYIHIMYDNDLY